MKRAALDFANTLRALQGAEPVTRLRKGWAQDTGGCPIARTATVTDGVLWSVGPIAAGFGPRGGQRYRVETPEDVRMFMSAFDAGEFPALLMAAPVDELAVIA